MKTKEQMNQIKMDYDFDYSTPTFKPWFQPDIYCWDCNKKFIDKLPLTLVKLLKVLKK